MNRIDRIAPSPGLLAVVEGLRRAGHQAYAVGGAVRDALLGADVGDWDVATDTLPGEVLSLFPRTYPVGVEHGTVGVAVGDETIEVTTFRSDVATDGRHAEVRFGATLEEDLARRDFTINAIAWDPESGALHDPFGGRADLAARRLRTVGEPDQRFREDYLRILRAFRFAARFELAYDEATWMALERHARGVARLSGERVRDELTKTLAQCRKASRALADWQATGVMARLLPEVAVGFGVEQNRWHVDDVGVHTLKVVDQVHPARPFLRVVALFHDVGKPATRAIHPKTGDWWFPDHAAVGARLAEQALERLRYSNRELHRASHLVRVHMDLLPEEAGEAAVRRWVQRIGEENVWDLYRLHLADWRGNSRRGDPEPLVAMYRRVRRVMREAHALSRADLAIDGRDLMDLGIAPGPVIGEILEGLLQRVIEDPAFNTRSSLLELARDMAAAQGALPAAAAEGR
jgi:tRNA nucleotidyltransferase (CCA-adding enzyme)